MPERLIMAIVQRHAKKVCSHFDDYESAKTTLKEFAEEIMKLCGHPVDDLPKSKFMEDVHKFTMDCDTRRLPFSETFVKFANLIDKHKADKGEL